MKYTCLCGKVEDLAYANTYNDLQLCVKCLAAYKERDKIYSYSRAKIQPRKVTRADVEARLEN